MKFAAIDRLGEKCHSLHQSPGTIGQDASIDWAIGVMKFENSSWVDFDSDSGWKRSHADLKVAALSRVVRFKELTLRLTNFGCNSIGNILQHGVILEKEPDLQWNCLYYQGC